VVDLQKIHLKVRPCVLERRKWEKFGEVSNIPRGEHKKGDTIREKAIPIESAENTEKAEIDIVNKI
jgi:hypothetical protein